MLTLPLAMLTIVLTAAAVSTFLAFLAAKRDYHINADNLKWHRIMHGAHATQRKYKALADEHAHEARRYLLVSSVSAVAALIAWAVLVVA